MSRDRKLLCMVIAVAFISQALMFTVIYLNAYTPSREQAPVEAARRNEYLALAFSAQLGKCERLNSHRKAI
jgi:hypothetical protein